MKALVFSVPALCLWSLAIAQNVGIGTTTPLSNLDIQGDPASITPTLNAHVNYSGPADVIAITGSSINSPGYGIGAYHEGGWIGMEAASYGGSYSGTAYGVRGYGFGTAGTRIGVYGFAQGGATNWAGYFEGRGKFTDQLLLDKSLYASDYLQTASDVFVGDTVFTKDIYAPYTFQLVRIGAGQDIRMKIDGSNNAYASTFRIVNGTGADCFATDEFGNARTYGHHFIDSNLGVGTVSPTQRLDVDNGNLIVQGVNSFQGAGDAGIVYLGGIHHYIKGEYGFGVKIGTYGVGDVLVIKELSGSVGIGTTSPAAGYRLSVDGKIISEELRIQNSLNWPDYVFDDDYRLMPLDELQATIDTLGHLPGIPAAPEVARDGIAVGEMQKRMMEKIEELTLYAIAQEQAIAELQQEVTELRAVISSKTGGLR